MWRADQIYPPAADAYAELRASLDLPPAPEIAVLCGWGHIDPDHPVLRGRALVLTSDRGVTRLENRLPDTAVVVSLGRQLRFSGDVIIDALRERGHRRILCEAGPHTFGALLEAGRVDELFLTTSPFLAGDAGAGSRLRLVEAADLVPLVEGQAAQCPPSRRPSLRALRNRQTRLGLVDVARSPCDTETTTRTGGERVRSRQDAEQFHVSGVAERLTLYETSKPPDLADDEAVDPELVERAATLLTVMPRNQLRKTIESLLAPHDLERGRQAVDALIDAAFAVEDETGHLRRIA